MKIVADNRIPLLADLIPQGIELQCVASEELTQPLLQSADALICRSVTKINKDLVYNTPLRMVASTTSGFDHMAVDELNQLGIKWAYAPGCNAVSVAEYVLSCLACLTQANHIDKDQLTVGVVGVGNVGKWVVNYLQQLKIPFVCYDPPRAERDENFVSANFDDLLRCDVITLHTPLTTEGEHATYHLFDKDVLSQLKPGCVLINAARGAVIATEALLANPHLILCLDVFEHEPSISLALVKQTFLATPHIAGHAIQGKWRGAEMAVDAVAKALGFTVNTLKEYPIPRPNCPQLTDDLIELALLAYNPTEDSNILKAAKDPSSLAQVFKRRRNMFPIHHEISYFNDTKS